MTSVVRERSSFLQTIVVISQFSRHVDIGFGARIGFPFHSVNDNWPDNLLRGENVRLLREFADLAGGMFSGEARPVFALLAVRIDVYGIRI